MSVKEQWPECVGMTKEEAEAQIKADRDGLDIKCCQEGSPATADFNPDRVRVIHDADGKVVSAPLCG